MSPSLMLQMLGSLNDRSFINVLEMPIIKMTRVADHLQGRKSILAASTPT